MKKKLVSKNSTQKKTTKSFRKKNTCFSTKKASCMQKSPCRKLVKKCKSSSLNETDKHNLQYSHAYKKSSTICDGALSTNSNISETPRNEETDKNTDKNDHLKYNNGDISVNQQSKGNIMFDKKCLNIAHVNIVTLPGKIDELRCLLGGNPIDVLCLAETRLDEYISNNDVEIENYNLLRNDRDRNGGGVAAYVNKKVSLSQKIRNDLMPSELELLVLELKHSKARPILLLIWYRPPESKMDKFDFMEHVLHTAEKENKDIILIGDINCDILKPCCYTKKMQDISDNYHLQQLIKDPTRITENSSTLIDHIYTSNVNRVSSTGVHHTGISDHSLVYISWGKEIKERNNVHNYRTSRKYKNFNAIDFINDLEKIEWSNVIKTNDVNDALGEFESLFAPICNKHAPLKRKRVRKFKSPWLTDEIMCTMHERDRIKKKAIKTSSSLLWQQYKTLRNKVNLDIKKSKRSFLSTRINSAKKKSKIVWDTLRHVVPGKSKNNEINCIKSDSGEHTQPKDIANVLNYHFANVGPNLASKIIDSIENVSVLNDFNNDAHNDQNNNLFRCKPVSEDYVLKHIKSLSDKKATGLDNMPAKLLKIASEYIARPVTHIVNLSMFTSMFPLKWKCARICPIYKKGDCTNACNYRPISILPVISKILERAVFDQLYPFLNDNNMIYDKQSGFRPNHSTNTALINITEDWYNSIDKGEYVGVVMLDLQKAFDTVNHEILMNKLSKYNISQECIQWFGSYLSNRNHVTSINGVTSDSLPSICGIPQGSILGPLLFILYINDLPDCVNDVNISMYADDTALYTSSKCIHTLVDNLNKDLSKVKKWLTKNKLSLNVDKSEIMIIASRQKIVQINDMDLNVNIEGSKLQRVHKCKHLGVFVDENLTWHEQVCQTRRKVLSGIYMLRKTKGLLPSHIQVLLYKSIIAPHFEYCNVIWGVCGVTDRDMLQRLQKRCAKIIVGTDYFSSGNEALSVLNWSPITDRFNYNESLIMYKIMNDMTPRYLKTRFSERQSPYDLRGYKNLKIPKPRTEFKKKSLSYRGATTWNNMDVILKLANDVHHFKQLYKTP